MESASHWSSFEQQLLNFSCLLAVRTGQKRIVNFNKTERILASPDFQFASCFLHSPFISFSSYCCLLTETLLLSRTLSPSLTIQRSYETRRAPASHLSPLWATVSNFNKARRRILRRRSKETLQEEIGCAYELSYVSYLSTKALGQILDLVYAGDQPENFIDVCFFSQNQCAHYK